MDQNQNIRYFVVTGDNYCGDFSNNENSCRTNTNSACTWRRGSVPPESRIYREPSCVSRSGAFKQTISPQQWNSMNQNQANRAQLGYSRSSPKRTIPPSSSPSYPQQLFQPQPVQQQLFQPQPQSQSQSVQQQ